jgi:hypothetical protein
MIQWKLPTPDEPRFLKRRRELAELLDLEPTPENTDRLIDFLVPFVEAKNKKEAREILLEASQREYGFAVLTLLGYGSTVPDPKGGSSGQR